MNFKLIKKNFPNAYAACLIWFEENFNFNTNYSFAKLKEQNLEKLLFRESLNSLTFWLMLFLRSRDILITSAPMFNFKTNELDPCGVWGWRTKIYYWVEKEKCYKQKVIQAKKGALHLGIEKGFEILEHMLNRNY